MTRISLAIAALAVAACAHVPHAEAPLEVRYRLRVRPGAGSVHVDATVDGLRDAPIDRWSRGWIDPFVAPAVRRHGNSISYAYDVAVSQSYLAKVDWPALGDSWFASFGKRLFALPEFAGELARIEVELDLPAGWSAYTSRGRAPEGFTFATLADLHESMFCLGDYRGDVSDVRFASGSSRVVVVVRGQAPIADAEFFDGVKRLVVAEANVFGRPHPKPIQSFAMHFYDAGGTSTGGTASAGTASAGGPPSAGRSAVTDGPPNIPGFNAGAPTHSTVVGFHRDDIAATNPELFGMLAHENLHTWIPGATHDRLGPWFDEGLNDYVAYGALLASGVHDEAQHLAFLDKWTAEYRWLWAHDRTSGAMPYRRGMLAAWFLDLEIRRATGGKRGLGGVLVRLVDAAANGERAEKQHLVAALRAESGRDLSALYEELVEEDREIEIARHLAGAGFRLSEDGARVLR